MAAAEGSAESTKFAYQTAKFQIGSCKGPIQYSQAETVFHPDDIPVSKKQNKRDVHSWKKARSKGLDVGPQWDLSVEAPSPLCKRRMRQIPTHDRPNMHQYNYRAEVLPAKNLEPIPKPNKFQISLMPDERKAAITQRMAGDSVLGGRARVTQEMPVNPRLDGKTEWNHSTYFDKTDYRRIHQKMEKDRKANSLKFNGTVTNYMSPEQRAKQQREEQRKLKASGSLLHIVQQTLPQDRPLTFNREAREPSRKTKTTAHTGVYEYSEREQQWMWSDTASFERHSPGDRVRVHNPCALNLASPTATPARGL